VARRSILDHLVGVIEPSFTQDEVAVTCVGSLIQVTVKKGAHPPYAVRDGGRHFLTRIDDRLNEMTREQIREAFRAAEGNRTQNLAEARERLRKAQKEALTTESLWLALSPSPKLDIRLSDSLQLLQTWMTDPVATGNRRSGWTFVTNLRRSFIRGDLLQHGEDKDWMRTTISERGEVAFVVDPSAVSILTIAKKQFRPEALLEYPVSVFRLMSKLLARFGKDSAASKVVAAFSMNGIKGWTLFPGSSQEPTRWPEPKTYEASELQIDPERLEFDAKLLMEHPDRCALRLIRLVYGELGFEIDAIPREFDQQRGVLSIG
jgi:hypothetical protein